MEQNEKKGPSRRVNGVCIFTRQLKKYLWKRHIYDSYSKLDNVTLQVCFEHDFYPLCEKTHNATSCTNDFKLKIAITTALTIQQLLLKLVQFCNIQPYERNL